MEWKSEGVMDDESVESMEPMEKVPLKGLDESELERLVSGWQLKDRTVFSSERVLYGACKLLLSVMSMSHSLLVLHIVDDCLHYQLEFNY